jgi:hypothetical protein
MVKKEKKKKKAKAVATEKAVVIKKDKFSPSEKAEMLISQAIDKGSSVETIERLLAMRNQLKAEFAKEEFDKAMAKFQSECPIIEKTKKVIHKGKVRYSYAPIEDIAKQVREILKSHGFSYIFDSEAKEKSVVAICKTTHSAGHNQDIKFEVPIDPESFMNAPQKVASALTFAKRYAFLNAFGIMTGDEDDDGSGSDDTMSEEEEKKHNDDLLESSIKIVEKENDVNILKEFKKGIEKSEKYSDKDKKKLLEKVEQKINELDVNNSEKTSELEPNDNG